MNKEQVQLPIGVFDSGVGGISVLAELIRRLPNEGYLYYGDSGNAPYGIKPTEVIKERSVEIADLLIKQGIKALVVACNTATSAAIEVLRQRFAIPIIGMEPALKPATECHGGGTIFVMATPVTLKEKKFDILINQVNRQCITRLPCPGLVEIIEAQGARGSALEAYLEKKFNEYRITAADTIVLGCTHYIFIQETIKKLLGDQIKLIDGNHGTVKQVERLLRKGNLIQPQEQGTTKVTMYNSSGQQDLLNLSKELLMQRLSEFHFSGKLELSLKRDLDIAVDNIV
ncbi:glutamate racemase [Alkaliphilus crotonatoxidans]